MKKYQTAHNCQFRVCSRINYLAFASGRVLQWQAHEKTAPLPRPGPNLQMSAVPFDDDKVGDEQPQPDPPADLLGGEKRFKGPAAGLLIHADAVILDFDFVPGLGQAGA